MKDYKNVKFSQTKGFYKTSRTSRLYYVSRNNTKRNFVDKIKDAILDLVICTTFIIFFVISYFWYQDINVEQQYLDNNNSSKTQVLSSVNGLKDTNSSILSRPNLEQNKRSFADTKEQHYPWKYIIIHHSAINTGNADIYHKYHQRKYHQGLLYHFIIGNGNGAENGEIQIGERWIKQLAGGHVHETKDEYNEKGIGICLVGNFETHFPTEKQMQQLVQLVRYLMSRFAITQDRVLLHRTVNQTYCPGTFFPEDEFRKALGKV